MKKQIGIDQLEVGMYMEADIKEGAKSSNKNVLLLGKGVLITSANQIRRIKSAGMANVTIDTTKGKDIDGGTVIEPLVVVQLGSLRNLLLGLFKERRSLIVLALFIELIGFIDGAVRSGEGVA